MFIPQNFKFKKTFRPRIKSNVISSSKLITFSFGNLGFKALNSGLLKAKHLEVLHKILAKALKKEGSFCIKVFPNCTFTKKPLEVRMGKGKGNIDSWVYPIKVGMLFLELKNVSFQKGKELFELCASRFPIPIKFIKKDDNNQN